MENNQYYGEIPAGLANHSNINYFKLDCNTLYARNPTLISFLDTYDPTWDETQTVPPTSPHAALSGGDLTVSWTPIAYAGDGGTMRSVRPRR